MHNKYKGSPSSILATLALLGQFFFFQYCTHTLFIFLYWLILIKRRRNDYIWPPQHCSNNKSNGFHRFFHSTVAAKKIRVIQAQPVESQGYAQPALPEPFNWPSHLSAFAQIASPGWPSWPRWLTLWHSCSAVCITKLYSQHMCLLVCCYAVTTGEDRRRPTAAYLCKSTATAKANCCLAILGRPGDGRALQCVVAEKNTVCC